MAGLLIPSVIIAVLEHAPRIVVEVGKLIETIRNRRTAAHPPITDPISELRAKIESLEAHDDKQVDLIAQLATQGEALSNGLRIVNRRITALLIASAGAVIVATIALLSAVLR